MTEEESDCILKQKNSYFIQEKCILGIVIFKTLNNTYLLHKSRPVRMDAGHDVPMHQVDRGTNEDFSF